MILVKFEIIRKEAVRKMPDTMKVIDDVIDKINEGIRLAVMK
jgi:hypothetical protein